MAIQQINLGSAPSGAGGDTQRAANAKINENFSNPDHAASRLVGTGADQVPLNSNLGTAATKDVGRVENTIPVFTANGIADSGIRGPAAPMTTGGSVNAQETLFNTIGSGVYKVSTSYDGQYFPHSPNLVMVGDGIVNVLAISDMGNGINIITSTPNGESFIRRYVYRLYTDRNTNKGTNGVLSAKSPVTHLYHDRVEHTGDDLELQPIEFVKNGVGNYTLKNTTGLAQEGWYIVIPQDANGNPLIAVEYDDNDGDINIRTYKRKFDYEQAKVIPDHDNPMDIPETRWIDLRFNDDPSLYDEVTDEPIE